MIANLFIGEICFAQIEQTTEEYRIVTNCAPIAGTIVMNNSYQTFMEAVQACRHLLPVPCREFVRVIE